MKLLRFDKIFVTCNFYFVGCFALFSVHFWIAFSFLLVTFQTATEGVRDFSCTDCGCIGLQVTREDSLPLSMAEKKTKKKNTGTQGTIFWEQGFKMQLINLFFVFIDSCSKIGEEQSSEDAEDGPPELLVSSTSRAPVTAVHLIQHGLNFSRSCIN